MQRRKIAILTPTFSQFSGIDRVVEQQAQELSGKGNKVDVFALEADISPKNYRVVVLGMPKNPLLQRIYRLLFFLDFKKIKRYSDGLKNYDQVISHFYPMNWIAHSAKKKHGIKYTYYNHGICYPELFGNIFERAYMRIFRFLNKLSINNADDAVSVSNFLRYELKKEAGLDSRVICNKIGKSRFGKNIDAGDIIKKYGLKNNKIILFVGRISPHKGVHLLIEAFKIINKKMPNTKLLIVGKPTFSNYYKKLKKAANENVIFAGFVNERDLAKCYKACDLYVTTSLWEGYDLPAAEAQFLGKKVVAFDIGSHPEIVKNGILVRKNNIKGFADAILKILRRKA